MSTQHILKDLAILNESTWVHLGQVAELMNDSERALVLYEQALAHNPFSEQSLVAVATVCRSLEKYQKAADYFQRALKIKETNGEVWGALGHCYLMLDDLHKAYSAYQQALFHLPNPKEPKLWYGIGILYDRYGSFEHAEDAFTAVIEMDPQFEKSNEIYFRLGIIYKQQEKFDNSMECFRYILKSPPPPLSELDILFQIGHVYEQKKDFDQAKETYEQVLKSSPKHAKVLQQLGWLYHQPSTGFTNDEFAMKYLLESSEAGTFYLI
jgi:tetratricopeptide (TPR) repeat protein